ncbi:Serine carboxypeptidase-like 1 [Linum grandiflorum]
MILFCSGLPAALSALAFPPSPLKMVSSIIYLDLPVGTGFSYTTDHSVPRSSDHDQVSQAEEFLRKWLRKHREFLKNPFYLAGDSYSGVTIPPILQRLSIGNEKGIEPMLNLKGYILGNPITDVWYQQNSQIPFAHGMALISDELYQALERSCKGEYYRVDSTNLECKNNLAAFHECLSGLNIKSGGGILDPDCDTSFPKPTVEEDISNFAQRRRILFDPPKRGCETYGQQLCAYWANDARVRKALHIREGTVEEWIRCKLWLEYDQDIGSSFEYHVDLSTKGYRSLIYSGDHDFRVPFLGTQAWIRALNYSIVEDWRSWHVEGQVAGYTRTYSNRMTYATVKGGNHVALENKPAEGFAMFKRWIQHELL